MGLAYLVDDGSFAVGPATKAEFDELDRCEVCTQVFERDELENGLCSWCARSRSEDDAYEAKRRELLAGNGCDGREL